MDMRIALFLLLLTNGLGFAQAPGNLRSDSKLPRNPAYTSAPDGFPIFDRLEQVINAFNYARRQEEKSLKIPVGRLGELKLPANYTAASPTERALYVINAERTARAGVRYGPATALGLPFEGLETHLTTVAQDHAADMTAHQFFSHTGTNGQNPPQRIRAQTAFGDRCAEFMARAENIYMFCFYSTAKPTLTTPTFAVEQAIFSWLYQDAGSAWGHRETILMQNVDPSGGQGFHNNHGSADSEGLLGIGVATVANYGPCSNLPGYHKVGHVVVMDIVDPAPGCQYAVPVNILSK